MTQSQSQKTLLSNRSPDQRRPVKGAQSLVQSGMLASNDRHASAMKIRTNYRPDEGAAVKPQPPKEKKKRTHNFEASFDASVDVNVSFQ